MMMRRAEQARRDVGVFAACLDAWLHNGDEIDLHVGAFCFAEVLHMVRETLRKK